MKTGFQQIVETTGQANNAEASKALPRSFLFAGWLLFGVLDRAGVERHWNEVCAVEGA